MGFPVGRNTEPTNWADLYPTSRKPPRTLLESGPVLNGNNNYDVYCRNGTSESVSNRGKNNETIPTLTGGGRVTPDCNSWVALTT